jgi:beta-lactam-binding protein with PASTA domain
MIVAAVTAVWIVIALVVIALNLPGDDKSQVPNLAGASQTDAATKLRAAGLKVGEVAYEESTTAAPDTILRTEPAANRKVKPGTRVKIWLAQAPAPPAARRLALPDVTNKSSDDAIDGLTAAGLTPGEVTYEPSSPVGEGLVIRTEPAANTQVPKGTVVKIVVATKPGQQPPTAQPCTVPDLAHKAREYAESELGKAKIRYEIKQEESDLGGAGHGHPDGSRPGPPRPVPQGHRVRLLGSADQGARPQGRRRELRPQQVTDLGLKLSVKYDSYCGATQTKDEVVASQSPSAGSTAHAVTRSPSRFPSTPAPARRRRHRRRPRTRSSTRARGPHGTCGPRARPRPVCARRRGPRRRACAARWPPRHTVPAPRRRGEVGRGRRRGTGGAVGAGVEGEAAAGEPAASDHFEDDLFLDGVRPPGQQRGDVEGAHPQEVRAVAGVACRASVSSHGSTSSAGRSAALHGARQVERDEVVPQQGVALRRRGDERTQLDGAVRQAVRPLVGEGVAGDADGFAVRIARDGGERRLRLAPAREVQDAEVEVPEPVRDAPARPASPAGASRTPRARSRGRSSVSTYPTVPCGRSRSRAMRVSTCTSGARWPRRSRTARRSATPRR